MRRHKGALDLRAGRLPQHSMHVVDSESCVAKLADNMAVLNASNGGSTADDGGRVATCWRPVGPCTSRSFAAAWSAGGYGGTDGLTTACGTLELRFERGSNVAMRPSACGRMRLVAELLLGPQSPCMLPQDIPGVPFHSYVLLVHPRLQQEAMAALRASAARGHDFSSWDHDHRRV